MKTDIDNFLQIGSIAVKEKQNTHLKHSKQRKKCLQFMKNRNITFRNTGETFMKDESFFVSI